jgi:hypothetical protein
MADTGLTTVALCLIVGVLCIAYLVASLATVRSSQPVVAVWSDVVAPSSSTPQVQPPLWMVEGSRAAR